MDSFSLLKGGHADFKVFSRDFWEDGVVCLIIFFYFSFTEVYGCVTNVIEHTAISM